MHENLVSTIDPPNALPEGFSIVQKFLDVWSLSDSRARAHKRQTTAMNEIQAFYDAMRPLSAAAIDYLNDYALGELNAEGENLLKLMLSFAEISTAVEWYGSPSVPDSIDNARFELICQTADLEPQQ